MFGSITGPPPPLEAQPLTRHELGRLADEGTGLVPMVCGPNPESRLIPAFPLAAYLVMVRAA